MTKTKKRTTEAQMKELQKVALQHTDCDQDSDTSFTNDTDEEIDTSEIEEEEEEEEDRIEHVKRSTAVAVAAKIPCWIETDRRMKWRLTMRIASLPDERWARKAT